MKRKKYIKRVAAVSLEIGPGLESLRTLNKMRTLNKLIAVKPSFEEETNIILTTISIFSPLSALSDSKATFAENVNCPYGGCGLRRYP